MILARSYRLDNGDTRGVAAVEREPDQLDGGGGGDGDGGWGRRRGKGKRQLWLDLALMRRHEKRGGSVFEGSRCVRR